jgi:hypothetical protein
LTKNESPEATVETPDHGLSSKTAQRSAMCVVSVGSSQLNSTRPSGKAVRFGSRLPGPAGQAMGLSGGAAAGRLAAEASAITSRDAAQSIMVECFIV